MGIVPEAIIAYIDPPYSKLSGVEYAPFEKLFDETFGFAHLMTELHDNNYEQVIIKIPKNAVLPVIKYKLSELNWSVIKIACFATEGTPRYYWLKCTPKVPDESSDGGDDSQNTNHTSLGSDFAFKPAPTK